MSSSATTTMAMISPVDMRISLPPPLRYPPVGFPAHAARHTFARISICSRTPSTPTARWRPPRSSRSPPPRGCADVADRPRHGRRRRRRRCAAAARHGRPLLARRRAVRGRGRLRGPARARLRAPPRRPGAARHARRLPRRPRAADQAMADRLEELGFALDRAPLEARANAGSPVGRPHLADAVLRHPDNAAKLEEEGIAGKQELFPAYLVPGARAYVARSRPTVAAGHRRHPRRGRRRGVGAPVLGRRRRRDDARHARALRRPGARRRGVLLRHPHGGADAAAARRGAAARAADHRLDRLPRARARALQRLRRLRPARARARPRPDRRAEATAAGAATPTAGHDAIMALRAPPTTPSRAGGLSIAVVLLLGLNLRTLFASLPPLLETVRADLGLSATVSGLLTTGPVLCLGVLAPLAPALARRLALERVRVARPRRHRGRPRPARGGGPRLVVRGHAARGHRRRASPRSRCRC